MVVICVVPAASQIQVAVREAFDILASLRKSYTVVSGVGLVLTKFCRPAHPAQQAPFWIVLAEDRMPGRL